MVARLKLTERHHQEWRYLTQHGKKLTRSRHSKDGQIRSSFLIGAWPSFVGGVIGLVVSVNGRDHCQLNNVKYVSILNISFGDVLCLTQGSFKE